MVISSCRFRWSISSRRNFANSSGLLFSISICWDLKKHDFCNHYFSMVYQKHSRVTMEVNLHLMKWNPLLKSMVSPILELYCYGALRMGKFSELIALLRKLYKLLLTKIVIGNMNWICFCWPTEILPIVQQVKSRRFSRTVRDKLPSVSGTEDVSGHDDAVKRNRAQQEKWKLLLIWNEEPNQLSWR